jgi:hypothetical protein
MTRTAADCAAMLVAIAGADPRDPTALLAPVPDYVACLTGAFVASGSGSRKLMRSRAQVRKS